MKISIVTAVYNRVETISRSIESLHGQTYADIEHIVQDGGSTDGTMDVVRRLAGEATSIVSGPDGGIYDAINRGIIRANGDVIGLLHSDDCFAHNKVVENVAIKFQDENIDGVYGDLQYVSSDDRERIVRHWVAGSYEQRKLGRGWMPPHPTLFLRREVFCRFGLYDTSLRISADYDAILRYLIGGKIKIAYIPEVLVRMRVGGESNRSLGHILLKSREDLEVIRRHELGAIGVLAMKNIRKIGQFI